MRSAVTLFIFAAALAGRALALTVNVTGLPIVPLSNLVVANDTGLDSTCQSQCQAASTAITNCNGNDSCLCQESTATAVYSCQQCFFTTLIEENRKVANPLAGSAPALGGYATACTNISALSANVSTLTLPANWDGPVAMHLSTGATVVYLVSVVTLGVGLLSVILTM